MNLTRLIARFGLVISLAACLTGCATSARILGQTQQVGPVSLLEQRTAYILLDVCGLTGPLDPTTAKKTSTAYTATVVDPVSKTKGTGRYKKGVLISGCVIVASFYGKLYEGLSTADQTNGSWRRPTELDSKQAVEMLQEGVILSDAACSNWFQQLDGARRASSTASGFASGLTNLTTIVQGQTGVESPAIAIVAAAGRAVTEGFSTFDNQYMLSPSLPDVYEAVRSYREQVATAYLGRTDIVSRASAMRYLQYYEATCTSLGVQQFLNQAIQKAGKGQVDPASTLTLAYEAAIKATGQEVGYELGSQVTLNEDDLTTLALVWETLPAMKIAQQDLVTAQKTAADAEAAAKTKASASVHSAQDTQDYVDAQAKHKTATEKSDAATAAYKVVLKTVQDANFRLNRSMMVAPPPDKKLIDVAMKKDGDNYVPSTLGEVARRKLEASLAYPRIRSSADKLYVDLQPKPAAGA